MHASKEVVGADCCSRCCLFRAMMLSLCLFFVALLITVGQGTSAYSDDDQPQHSKHDMNMVFPQHSPPQSLQATARRYLDTVNSLVSQLRNLLFPPPNLEGRMNEESSGGGGGSGGAIGEKVKAAVGKSLEKTKETVEGSAKKAGETLRTTTDKIQKTLSQRQAEL